MKKLFQLNSPELPLSTKHYIELQENLTFQAYHRHQINMAKLFGADRDQAGNDMMDVLEFEVALANVGLIISVLSSDQRRYQRSSHFRSHH